MQGIEMLVDTKNYQSVQADGFVFLHDKGHIIVTQTKGSSYLIHDDILLLHKAQEAHQCRNLFRTLATAEELPIGIAECVARRSRDLRGEALHLVGSAGDPTCFCSDNDLAPFYDISDPCPVVLTISEVFNNRKDFVASYVDCDGAVFGFWDVEKDEICTSYLWGHPMQTEMCFSDSGRHALSIGSLFLKFTVKRG